MPFLKKFACGDIEIAVWEITETAEELSSLVPPALLAEVGTFASLKRRAEWLAVRLLLQRFFGDDARIVYDAAGKPSLNNNDAYISISHTRGYAALAFSKNSPMGVDVELSAREVGEAFGCFMRGEELDGVPAELLNRAKLIRWTASEAVYKLVGNLGGGFRDNIVLERALPLEGGVLSLSLVGLPRGNSDNYSVAYLFDAPLLVVICREGNCAPLVCL